MRGREARRFGSPSIFRTRHPDGASLGSTELTEVEGSRAVETRWPSNGRGRACPSLLPHRHRAGPALPRRTRPSQRVPVPRSLRRSAFGMTVGASDLVPAQVQLNAAPPPALTPGPPVPYTSLLGGRAMRHVDKDCEERTVAVLAVVSVLGKDQKGVVAQFATYMAERGINIEDIEQRVVRGFFVMDMLVDLKDLTVDLSELITGLLELGRRSTWRSASTSTASGGTSASRCWSARSRTACSSSIDDASHRQTARPDRRPCWPTTRTSSRSPKSANLPFEWQSSDDPDAALRVARQAARGARRRTWSSWPATCGSCRRRSCAVPAQDHQHPPVAAALLPRRRAVQAGVRERRPRARVHRPLRHRAARRRPGHHAGRLPHQRRRRHAGRRQAQGPGARRTGAEQGGAALPGRGAGRRRGQSDLQAGHQPVHEMGRRRAAGRDGMEKAGTRESCVRAGVAVRVRATRAHRHPDAASPRGDHRAGKTPSPLPEIPPSQARSG